METERHDRLSRQSPPAAARVHWRRFWLWVPACLVYGGLIGWVALLVEPFWAPVLLFSLLVGAVLGASVVGMSRVGQVGNRLTVLVGTLLAASAAVFAQHYVGYRLACRAAVEEAQTYRRAAWLFQDKVLGEMPVPPDDFLEFLRWRAARGLSMFGLKAQGAVVWMIWTIDGLLVLGAALAVVVPALKKPYCDRCRSWFVTTRRGPVDPGTARKLAAVTETELPDEVASAGYRLSACHGGCGPTRFELRWEMPGGERSSARAWLDAERRNQVVRAVDERTSYR